MSYNVQLYPNIELGPLPQGWETQLEDLAYQATPSIEYNRDYVEYFISVVNGEETQYQQSQGQGAQGDSNPNMGNYTQSTNKGSQTQYGAPVGQSNQPQQPAQGNWLPQGMTGGQRQQLQQRRQGQGQGQVPPMQPQQPVVTDDMLPQDLVDMPNVPNPGAPVQPPVQGQGIPQGQQFNQPVEETYKEQPQVSNGLPDVNELLKGMQ